MAIYKGNTKIVKLYKGSTEIIRKYKGTTLIYQNILLPAGYIACEYLESSSTQYINTGFTPTNTTKVNIDIALVGFSGTGNVSHWCCVLNSGSPRYGLFFGYDQSQSFAPTIQLSWGSSFKNIIYSFTEQTRFNVVVENASIYVNGSLIGSATADTFTAGQTLQIFRSKSGESARVYSCKVYDNGTLVRNLIPCLDTSGTPCMYDTVSKTALYNAGTGEFTYQVKLPNGYIACEYLESTGKQYIDTGYYATTTSGINIDYAYTASGNAGLCGIFQGQTPRTDTLFVTTLSGQTSTEIYLISQGAEATNNTPPGIGTKHNAKINYLNNGKLIIDNGRQWNNGTNGVVSSRTIKLFCRDNGGNLAYTNARIYISLMSEGGNLVRHFVPCLDNNNVPCMYDAVEKQTYYNAGTGTFIAG